MAALPPHAKKVFSGIIYDVYQYEQMMFDGSTATFEMLKRPNTLQVIATVEDKILMNKESQPGKTTFYGLPGGRQEPSEDPLSGAKRELLEETGYAAQDWSLYKEWQPITKIDWTIYVFLARNCQKVQEPTPDAGEQIEPQLLSFEAFLDIAVSESFWGHEFTEHILRLKLDPPKLEAFRAHLFDG